MAIVLGGAFPGSLGPIADVMPFSDELVAPAFTASTQISVVRSFSAMNLDGSINNLRLEATVLCRVDNVLDDVQFLKNGAVAASVVPTGAQDIELRTSVQQGDTLQLFLDNTTGAAAVNVRIIRFLIQIAS